MAVVVDIVGGAVILAVVELIDSDDDSTSSEDDGDESDGPAVELSFESTNSTVAFAVSSSSVCRTFFIPTSPSSVTFRSKCSRLLASSLCPDVDEDTSVEG